MNIAATIFIQTQKINVIKPKQNKVSEFYFGDVHGILTIQNTNEYNVVGIPDNCNHISYINDKLFSEQSEKFLKDNYNIT